MASDTTQRAEKMLAELNALHAKMQAEADASVRDRPWDRNDLDNESPWSDEPANFVLAALNNFPALAALAEEALAWREWGDEYHGPHWTGWANKAPDVLAARAKTDKALEAL